MAPRKEAYVTCVAYPFPKVVQGFVGLAIVHGVYLSSWDTPEVGCKRSWAVDSIFPIYPSRRFLLGPGFPTIDHVCGNRAPCGALGLK